VTHICKTNVPVVLHMHLAARSNVTHARPVRDQRQSTRPRATSRQTEFPCNHGAQSVGTNQQRRANCLRCIVAANAHVVATVQARNALHAHCFMNACSCGARAIEQQFVEHFATQRQTTVAETTKPVFGDKRALNFEPIRRAHDHARELRGTGCFNEMQRTHGFEQARRFGAQILGTRFRARKGGAINERDVNAGRRQEMRRRRPRRAASND
jgi:hypothetical protein